MSTSTLFSPKLVLPLSLLTPYVFVLHYGISVLELFIWAFLLMVLMPTIIRTEFKVPRFLLIFYLLFTIGYVGALINGVFWQVPIGIWNLNHFYKLLLGIGAFCIGMQYRGEIGDLFKSKLVLVTILVLGLIAVTYPFLSYDTRIAYFGIFYPPDSGFERYFTSRRLPGLGVNANVYAFMVFSVFLFSFRAYLDSRIRFVIPLVSFLIILVLSSKLSVAFAVGAGVILILNRSVRVSVSRVNRHIRLVFRRRALSVGIGLIFTVVGLAIVATQTTVGKNVMDTYATVGRFEAILEAGSLDGKPHGFELRFQLWKKGIQRAELAPVLGIAKDPFLSMKGTLVGFYGPHNEFLRMWLLYGFAGMVAWVYLLSYMLYVNRRNRTGVEWMLFYGALAVFMMFDGGVDDPRVAAYLQLMLGLNWSQIRRMRDNMADTRTLNVAGGQWLTAK